MFDIVQASTSNVLSSEAGCTLSWSNYFGRYSKIVEFVPIEGLSMIPNIPDGAELP